MSPVRPRVTLIGRQLEPEHHRLRDFLTRIAQPYEWLEAGSVEADATLAPLGSTSLELPILVDGNQVLAAVSVRALAEAWNMSRPPFRHDYDIAIVGAGPAGLSAAVYAASDGLSTILLERRPAHPNGCCCRRTACSGTCRLRRLSPTSRARRNISASKRRWSIHSR